MKKLVIAFVAIAAAVVANAASVKWTSGGASSGFLDHTGTTMKGMTDYTMTVWIYSDADCTQLVETMTDAEPNAGGAYTGQTGTIAAGDYYAKALITNGSWQREAAATAFNAPATGTPTLNFLDGSNFSTKEAKWGSWQAVPEPTSGLLLLIGMAGLALRRRRA